jgi:hypothetical protein
LADFGFVLLQALQDAAFARLHAAAQAAYIRLARRHAFALAFAIIFAALPHFLHVFLAGGAELPALFFQASAHGFPALSLGCATQCFDFCAADAALLLAP